MTTDLFSGTAQSDGEGITFGDMNDAPRFGMAKLFDQTLESLVGDVQIAAVGDPSFPGTRGANAPSHLAYAIHGGSAYLRAGSAVNKVQIAPGVLFQKIANQSGAEPTFLAYSFVGTEEVAITAGSGANPRVDLVQMKLEWIAADSQLRDFQDAVTGAYTSTTTSKKRRVQCTLSVKTGTPAASPQYPDPDAGFVAVAGVVVGTSYAITTALIFGQDTAGANAVVHDQRMPIRVTAVPVLANVMSAQAAWGTTGAFTGMQASSATNELRIPFPEGGGFNRLIGLAGRKDGANSFAGIVFAGATNFGSVVTLVAGKLATIGGFPAASHTSFAIGYAALEGSPAVGTGLGPVVVPSATNKISAPIWSNGLRCAKPLLDDATGSPGATQLTAYIAIVNAANTAQIFSMTFFFAGA